MPTTPVTGGSVARTVDEQFLDLICSDEDLLRAEAFFPGWLAQLITTRVKGLEAHAELLRHLEDDRDAIKVVVEVGSR